MPKVIIAEVRSHNDPAFVNVVRRQLGLCRSEEREMSLMAVCVTPDGDEENVPTLQSLGLASWQQKLVNWLSDHPEVHDLYAFVSNEGELILSLMDLERNTATNLLRQGLVEVLTGVSTSGASSAALSRAPVPARYFSGIGSVSSPSAGFEPEQLIEATYRCLEAASGKAKLPSRASKSSSRLLETCGMARRWEGETLGWRGSTRALSLDHKPQLRWETKFAQSSSADKACDYVDADH